MALPFIRSKIICTIGPASSDPKTLDAMVKAGMDVARINTSHGTHEDHRKVFNHLREYEQCSILFDLPGPKIRLGHFEAPIQLVEGQLIHFTTEDIIGNAEEFPVNYEKLPEEVQVGGHLFINDGIIDVEVTDVDKDLKGFNVKVVSGGTVSSRKGVNAPGANLSLCPPTPKDLEGIKLGVELGCDWFAASFVRSKNDVDAVRAAIMRAGGDQPIISKIEHEDGVQNIAEIIEASDGIMVARGDLGIEIPPWDVPLLQKKIIEACNITGKPVIVATQMLESMIENPRPTRAEASDVANALLDGADAVMLSGETAVGKYPLDAVRTMNSIGAVVQERIHKNEHIEMKGLPIKDIIGDLATRAVDAVMPAAILVITRSGKSALMVSKHRPRVMIITVAKDPKISRRMNMYWGVKPINVLWTDDRDELIVRVMKEGLKRQLFYMSDIIQIVSGSTLIAPGLTTTLEILKVEDIMYMAGRRD